MPTQRRVRSGIRYGRQFIFRRKINLLPTSISVSVSVIWHETTLYSAIACKMFTARGMPPMAFLRGRQGKPLRAWLRPSGKPVQRAQDSTPVREVSTQPTLVDFYFLDLPGWKRWGALSLFRGRDGVVRFTDGRAVATRRTSDSGVDVAIHTSVPGRSTNMPAETLLSAT
eukprot:6194391-Pleurochrysis_carterae.AAC.7